MVNAVLEEMDRLDADIVMINTITHSDEYSICGTIGYYTREQIENGKICVNEKSSINYYKLVDGQRVEIENVE